MYAAKVAPADHAFENLIKTKAKSEHQSASYRKVGWKVSTSP
jgi:hypothetical protein